MNKIEALLIDDDDADRKLIKKQLTEHGKFKLHEAKTLTEADKILNKTSSIQIVLLDLSLPESNRIETVKKFRKAHTFIPFVVLTGLDDEDMGLKAIENGAQDFLIKTLISFYHF